MKRKNKIYTMILATFFMLACGLVQITNAQTKRPTPTPTPSVSEDIKRYEEIKRKNAEATKYINRYMESAFKKYPNLNKEIPNTTITYLILADSSFFADNNSFMLLELTEFDWETFGNVASST